MLLKWNFKRITLILGLSLVISACNTTKQNESAEPPVKQGAVNAPQSILIKKADLVLLQDSAKQWKNAQTNVDKISQLEHKLTQLTATLTQQIEQSKPPLSEPKETIFNLNTRLDKSPALFSIQVGAFKNEPALHSALAQLKLKAPNIIHTETVVNIEPVVANKVTLYRLKLGSYKNKAAAQSDCKTLIQQQVACFVGNYTQKI